MTLREGDPRHGTLTGYTAHACRCQPCTEAQAAYNASRAAVAKQLIWDAKAVPCFDCGGSFPPECMDFDHRDPATKLFQVASGRTRTLDSLRSEIAKCDVVCANCHRIRTARQVREGVLRPGRPRRFGGSQEAVDRAARQDSLF